VQLTLSQTWDGRPLASGDQVQIQLRWQQDDLLICVDAPFYKDPKPDQAVGPTWELWEYEVVEIFLVGENDHYTEVELSPHGHHLLLRLEGCRNIVARELPLEFEADIEGDRWRGKALVKAEDLPLRIQRLNAYAIHGVGAQRIYAAWTPVPGAEPDFHRLNCFPEVGLGPA
jgi:hypothetical protein